MPQVDVIDDKYRVDFGVFSKNPNDDLPSPFLAIECDGFNYHHANKEQVSKDNNRIREIQFTGIEILRVNGSDIYRNPIEEADKILSHIRRKYFSDKHPQLSVN